VLLAARGEGVSQGIGVGGRDMSEAVGGLMTLAALDALAADPATELIAVVGKPPAPAVRRAVEMRLAAAGKPAVMALLGPGAAAGLGDGARDSARVRALSTLEDAADAAIAALAGRPWAPAAFSDSPDAVRARVDALRRELPAGPIGLRGLYAGGTLAHEAIGILVPLLGPIDGNLGSTTASREPAPHAASPHQVLDLGADEYTVGRAHPMLDAALRASLIERAARDPHVGLLLIDVVLGHGAAADPAGDLAPALRSARAHARADGRNLAVVASVIGTAADPQGLAAQVARLEAEGAWVLPSNAQAARAAACLVGGPDVADVVLGRADAPASAAPAGTTRAFVAPDEARLPGVPTGAPRGAPAPGTVPRGGGAPGVPLLGRALSVVNVGLESFAADLGRRGVPTVHVAWVPPAGGDPRAAALLDLLEDDD
jgi:FdrA protein